jgi:putative transposase
VETKLQAIKIRLYPTKEQEKYISSLIGSCRFVFNSCLAFKIKKYNEEKKSVSFGEIGKHLVWLKTQEDTAWLNDVHSKVLQQTLINLEASYKSFFKNGAGFPKFKSKKSSKQSCRFPTDAISGIEGNRINIIKALKNVLFRCSRRDEIILNQFQDEIKSGTLIKTKSGNFYLSILIDIPKKLSLKLDKTDSKIGLDIGIKDFIVDSNGNKYENLKLIRNNEKKLAKLHRNVSKKKKDSMNRNKAIKKLARFHEKIDNIKDYYLHQIVNKIVKENQLVVVEDLNVSGMLKNHNLARSIQELSISKFVSMLKYKLEWNDRDFVQIDRFFPSSKKCNICGDINHNLTLKDRTWKCSSCGTLHDRDINASKNILKEGIRFVGLSSPELTLGEMETNKPSMNQERNVIS